MKLYNEGYTCYIKSALIYKHQLFFSDRFSLSEADILAFKALSNFTTLLEKHVLGIEIREKDFQEKYNLIKDLIIKINKAKDN